MEKEQKKSTDDTYIWIIIAVIGYIVLFILYWIFVFRPVARIESVVNKTAQDIENTIIKVNQTSQKVDITDQKIDMVIDSFDKVIPQLEKIFCNFFPSLCPSNNTQSSSRRGLQRFK